LDALAAAYTALCVITTPQETMLIGDEGEGRIALPVAKLKEKYS
jgi:hypothetical protein